MFYICRLIDWFNSIEWGHDNVIASATVFIAVLNFILAFGTIFLWLATRRLVKGSERTAERQLRAYLCVEITESPIFNPDREIVVILSIINRGQTPAYRTTNSVVISLDTTIPSKDLRIKRDAGPHHPVVIGPNGSIKITPWFPRPLSNVEKGQLIAGTHHIYIFGTIDYTDAFGNTRHTSYRMKWNISPDGTPLGIDSCEDGNDSD
jgi:hypothetical protein